MKSKCGNCGRKVHVVYEVSIDGVILADGKKVCLSCADQLTAAHRDSGQAVKRHRYHWCAKCAHSKALVPPCFKCVWRAPQPFPGEYKAQKPKNDR